MEDVPNDLALAMYHGGRILEWQENFGEGEMPPEWMWPYEEELNVWFDRVIAERKEKYSTPDSDDSDDMMSNELAQGRGRNS